MYTTIWQKTIRFPLTEWQIKLYLLLYKAKVGKDCLAEMEETMVTAIVGANWGDEGKGKITDMLGEESDIIVRFQEEAMQGIL